MLLKAFVSALDCQVCSSVGRGLSKTGIDPPVVISVVLSKAKNQFWYTLVPWMGVSKESNNRLL